MAAIVIPANNEELSIGRLLEALLSGPDPLDATQIVVVANGCVDRTADVARQYDGVTVLETPVASKINALRLGDSAVNSFPRLYVDADVVIDAASIRAITAALADPSVHAAGPSRRLLMEGVSRPVRLFYDVWMGLPAVESELYGRGVFAVDDVGHARVADWPEVMSDDLHAALAFSPTERVVVDEAVSVIRPPRTYRDLVRRRIRVMQGNVEVKTSAAPARAKAASSSTRNLGLAAIREPRRAPAIVVFLVTAAVTKAGARRAARRNDSRWLRDESSRN